jgi:glycosyltransferase involved in cell wall biosynthesis
VEEILEDGATGFIVDDAAQAVEALARIGEIDRRRCREAFERRFTAARMAREYVALYETIASRPSRVGGPDRPLRATTARTGR